MAYETPVLIGVYWGMDIQRKAIWRRLSELEVGECYESFIKHADGSWRQEKEKKKKVYVKINFVFFLTTFSFFFF